jgi:DNA-binding MarR family transcriptional regulator
MDKENVFLSSFNKMVEIRRALNKLNKKNHLPDYHYTEIRCIALIGTMEEANVTKLSEASYMTRGGISKTVKKLLSYGVIESYQKSANKKEIYFELTPMGKEIFRKYKEFTHARDERDKIVFNELSEVEKDTVIKFFNRFYEHLKGDMDKAKILNYEEDNL